MSKQRQIEGRHDLSSVGGGGLVPPFERARVVHAMQPGVISCPPDASMAVVARMMAANRVHAVVVSGIFEGQPWRVVTDRDLLEVALDADQRIAGTCASEQVVTVTPGEHLERAAELMLDHGVSHLLVVDRERELPLGIISTLDIADVVAGVAGVGPSR